MSHTHMDDVAHLYEHTIPQHVLNHYLRKRVAFIRRRIARGLVLDVGCGTGLLGVGLREAGLNVIGLDESFGMLKTCQQVHGISSLCGDSAQLPIAANSVDAAVCIAALHHVMDARQVRLTLAEMFRVVKPGGWMLLWDHNPLNPYWPFLMKRMPQDQEPTRLVPLKELLNDLRLDGVASVEARRSGFVPDFAPPKLLWLFQTIEWVVERMPGLRCWCAHNVVVATKSPPVAPVIAGAYA